jgi:hypothetical protein
MKKALKYTINIATIIANLLCSVLLFPHFDNHDLLQSGIWISFVSIILILASFALSQLGTKLNLSQLLLTTIGIGLVILFFSYQTLGYYPYVNKRILHLKSSCGGNFIRGDSVNYQKLNPKIANYDSLSKNSPDKFVEETKCDPSIAWTFESIEDNYNGIFLRYCALVFVASLAIFTLIDGISRP